MIGIENESELQAEHEAAKAAIAEEKERERAAKHQEFLAKEKAARIARDTPILEGIAAAALDLGVLCVRVQDGKLFLNGLPTSHDLDIKEHYTNTGWRTVRTNKLKVVTGAYGDNRKTWMPLTKGGYNYQAIASAVLACQKKRIAQDNERKIREHNTTVVAAFKKAQNLSNYEGAVQPSTNVVSPIALSFKVNRNVTVEDAARIVEALKPFGIFSFNKED